MLHPNIMNIGDLYLAAKRAGPTFEQLPLQTYKISDRDHRASIEDRWRFVHADFISMPFIYRGNEVQSFVIASDGKRFGTGFRIRTHPEFLPSDAERLQGVVSGYELDEGYKLHHEQIPLTLDWRTRRSDERLRRLEDEGRVALEVRLNMDSEGRVAGVPQSGSGEGILTSLGERDSFYAHMMYASQVFAGTEQSLLELQGLNSGSADFFIYLHSPDPLELRSPFYANNVDFGSFVYFSSRKKQRDMDIDRYVTMAEYSTRNNRKRSGRPAVKPANDPSLLLPGQETNLPATTKKDIAERLREYVVGQDAAVDVLASSAYVLQVLREKSKIAMDSENVLLHGPTGSGKSHLLRSLATVVQAPLYVGDANALTAAGYKGMNPDELVHGLLEAAGGNVREAERGIIFIDEVDKLASSGNDGAVGTLQVQHALLPLLESAVVDTPRGPLHTDNILFVAGGAFAGSASTPSLEMILDQRLAQDRSRHIGFSQDSESLSDVPRRLIPADFTAYGLIPELVGRFSQQVSLHPLDLQDLVRIASEPKNAPLKQLQSFFSTAGLDVHFEEDALRRIAERAYADGMGARSLKTYFAAVRNALLDEVGVSEAVSLRRSDVDEILSRA